MTANSGTYPFFARHISYRPGDGLEPSLGDRLPAGQTTSIGSVLQAPEGLFDISEQMPLVLQNRLVPLGFLKSLRGFSCILHFLTWPT